MLFNEIIGVYCENHAKYTNKLRAQQFRDFNTKTGGSCSKWSNRIRFAVRRTWVRHMLHARISYLQVCDLKVLRGTRPVICLNS